MKFLIKKNNFLFVFLLLPFVAMVIPDLIGFGGENVFLRDFLAKRLMTVFVLPFVFVALAYLISRAFDRFKEISLEAVVYFILWSFYVLFSIVKGNSLSYIVVDAFVTLLPLIFILPITRFNFEISETHYLWLLIIGLGVTFFNIKLQYSYFNIIGIGYILFILKFNWRHLLLFLSLPIVLKNALLGKSALIMFLFVSGIFFYVNYEFIDRGRKKILLVLIIVGAIGGSAVFGNYIYNNESYKHMVYFVKNTNFSELKFNDHSTGQRLYEAKKVWMHVRQNNWVKQIIGEGLGAVIDFSDTPDVTVKKANSDITRVHHIHIGLFAVLFRYGFLGTLMFLIFIYRVSRRSFYILFNSNKLMPVLSALYVLILSFDSFVSFPHMMSNFMFWFSAGIVLRADTELVRLK